MYMDLTDMISGGTEEQQIPEQKLTKEEYAAKKQQEQEKLPETVEALQKENKMLKQCLLEMSEIVYA